MQKYNSINILQTYYKYITKTLQQINNYIKVRIFIDFNKYKCYNKTYFKYSGDEIMRRKKIEIKLLIFVLVLLAIISTIIIILTKNNVSAVEGTCGVCWGTGQVSERCSGGYTTTCSTCDGNRYVAHQASNAYSSSMSYVCNACKKSRNSRGI